MRMLMLLTILAINQAMPAPGGGAGGEAAR
jgi:hypothetical protein